MCVKCDRGVCVRVKCDWELMVKLRHVGDDKKNRMTDSMYTQSGEDDDNYKHLQF